LNTPPFVCTCAWCRRTIRESVALAFVRHRRWLGEWQIRFLANLGWVPLNFFRQVLAEMLRLGLLIRLSAAGRDDFDRYLLSRLAVPVRARAGKGGPG
jgi:hypothetical protein